MIIETNPCLGHLLNNALEITNYLIIPINSDLWAVESIDLILDAINKVYRNDITPYFLVTGALERQNIDKEIIFNLGNSHKGNLVTDDA